MKSRFFALAGLKHPSLRDHLAASALATVLFILVFFKALFGGYDYGALPQQQLTGVVWQYPRIAQMDLPVTERQPNVVDPDYHFLYELDAAAAAHELRAGHLPFFDFSRMLGVPLWGSLIYDFGNPLNLLLRYLSVPKVHLIKVLVCMLLAANGFVVLMRELGAKSSLAWAVGTLLFLGSNYSIYYIHWIGAYGVTCVAPMLLGMILRFLRAGGAGAFFGVFLCACWVVVAHCTHIGFHLMILCGVACAVTALISRQDWKLLWPRLALLGFAGICAAVACFEILWQVKVTSDDSSRLSSKIMDHGYPYMVIPPADEAYSTFFFANIQTNGSFWESLFIPWAAVLSVWVVFGGVQSLRREVRVVGWLAVFFTVFFFVGWLDAPLYLFLGKLYAPNPLAWRGLLNLYLPVAALAGLGAEWIVSAPVARNVRISAWVGLVIVAIIGAVVVLVDNTFVRDQFFYKSGVFYESYVRSWAFWLVLLGNALWLVVMVLRKNDLFKAAILVTGAVAICVGMATSRIPFYPTRDIIQVTRGDASNINTPRLARLLPGTEYLLGAAAMEIRYVLDSPLSTLGLKMLNGYHTSMSKQELKVFDALVSEHHLQKRQEPNVLRSYSFGYYRTFLDGRGVVQGNELRPDKALLLKLLGVDYIIDGVGLSRIKPQSVADSSQWPGVALHVATACHLVEGTAEQDVVALFCGTPSPQSVTNMAGWLRPIRFEPTADGRAYQANLTGTPGTLVVPYHLGRFFKVALDGRVVDEPAGLGVCLVQVTPQSKVLEIRPRRAGIVARTLGGLIAGCLMALVGCYSCQRLAKRGLRAVETKPSHQEAARLAATPSKPSRGVPGSKRE